MGVFRKAWLDRVEWREGLVEIHWLIPYERQNASDSVLAPSMVHWTLTEEAARALADAITDEQPV